MVRDCSRLPAGPLHDVAVAILQRIKRRDYGTIAPFRQDLQEYCAARDARNRALQDFPSLVEVWRAGMEMLRDKYWRKFLFDPDTDLVSYA